MAVSYIRAAGGGQHYSTQETWTGDYWIDGKKIYRKVIHVKPLGSLRMLEWRGIDSGIRGADTVFFEVAVVVHDGTTSPIPMIYPDGIVDDNVAVRFNANNGEIQLRPKANVNLPSSSAIFILRYTKK